MDKNESFNKTTILRSYLEAAEALQDDASRGIFLYAILKYAFLHKTPTPKSAEPITQTAKYSFLQLLSFLETL